VAGSGALLSLETSLDKHLNDFHHRHSCPFECCRMRGTVTVALEEARLAAALASRLLPALAASPAWGRLQPGLFRLAWLYGRLNARVRNLPRGVQT